MWIDSHAHLYDLPPAELDRTLDHARHHSVDAIINVATNLDTAHNVLAQCRRHPAFLSPAIGISPFDVLDLQSSWEKDLASLIANSPVVAIGEIGLDAGNPSYPEIEAQRPVLVKQMEVANRFDLPVILHSRGAERDVLEACHSVGIKKAVFHCYTGPVDLVPEIIASGYFISFSGIATFKKSNAPETIAATPLDMILIETDSPYLAPVPYRGKTNRPGWVSEIGNLVAKTKHITPEEAAGRITRNAISLFGKLGRKP